MRRAVFLDRDGVLNRDRADFVKTVEEFVLLPGAAEAAAALHRAGFAVVVVSNQSGIPRGLVTEESLAAMHRSLRAAVGAAGGRIAAIYHCPHLPGGGCECRKPAPGMLLRAARENALDLGASIMVGDKPDDIAAGAAAGCRTVLVLSGQTRSADTAAFSVRPDHVAADLAAAVRWILSQP